MVKTTNYGYTCDGWRAEKIERFANALAELLTDLRLKTIDDRLGPYIETNGVYGGVRIRRITHLTPESETEMINSADSLYRMWENFP